MSDPELFVAVVITPGKIVSERWEGDWSCFVADSAEAAVERAMQARTIWEVDGVYGPYEIRTGKLTACVPFDPDDPSVPKGRVACDSD